MSRVLILGGKGRLGAELARRWSGRHQVATLARPEMDAGDPDGLEQILTAADFDVLVNAVAMTNVDACESQREEATAVNTVAPGVMARAAAKKNARFIHISTDYVFDGAQETPYVETDAARPLGHYGQTKLDGEREALALAPQHVALRVSWVFGPEKPSFVDMIVDRALAHEKVEAIADKTSCPTFAGDAADWIEPFFDRDLPGGLYHMCNAGACTWQSYGQYALDCIAELGRPLRARTVDPIPLASMKSFVAPRPPHTVMNTTKLAATTGLTPRPWQEALKEYLTKKYA